MIPRRDAIEVPERGHLDLNVSDPRWRAIAGNSGLWRLVADGVVRIAQPSTGTVRLNATKYVGRALVANTIIAITEKIPGAFAALLAFASGRDFRVAQVTGPKTEFGPLASLLVGELIAAVQKYVAGGREFRYVRNDGVGSLVRGRINVTQTARLRARGFGHLVSYNRDTITYSTEKNRLIRVALLDVQRLARLIDISASDVSAARGLALLFDDCLDAEVLFGSRRHWLSLAERELGRTNSDEDRDLLTLIAVILSRAGIENAPALEGAVPRSWFVDLETLFEAATLRVLQELHRPAIEVVHGKTMRRPVFHEASLYSANPDLVVKHDDSVLAVGDVKYKAWNGYADPSDVYQLLVHSRAFNADRCFLIFPHPEFEVVRLGRSSYGPEAWVFAVNPLTLREDCSRILSELGINLGTPTT